MAERSGRQHHALPRFLRCDDVEVDLKPDQTFSARAIHGTPLPPLTGRWAATLTCLVTTAYAGRLYSSPAIVGRCLADAGPARARR